MQKITPFLWFDNEAEEASNFYVSIFKNSKIQNISLYDKSSESVSGKKQGTVMTAAFQLEGQNFIAINGGPNFKFTEAVSFVVNCKNQKEVDEFWYKLSEGGQEGECGWLKDKYGLSWQITQTVLLEMLEDENPERTERVMKEMLKMKKLDIDILTRAYNEE